MKPFSKSIIVICIVFIIRFVISCCECNSETQNFNVNNLAVNKIDNSGTYPITYSDTVCRSAVAFELILSETQVACSPSRNIFNAGFSEAFATECDCAALFKPDKTIDSISIISNYRLNYFKAPGSIVSECFVASISAISDNLYISLAEIIDNFNHKTLSDEKAIRFFLYLTIPVEMDIVSFTFVVYFTDNSNLTYSFPDFYVKDCK